MRVCFLGLLANGRYHPACRYSGPMVWNSASATFLKICHYGRQWDFIWCNDTVTQSFRWHCTKSSDCQVRVRGAPWNLYGVNVSTAVIGAYMWQWWLVQILWHLPYVFSSFCCLMNYYTVTFATCWYMGLVEILQLTFCVNLTVVTENFL